MFYDELRRSRWKGSEEQRRRTIEGLLRIRDAFDNADRYWRSLAVTDAPRPPADPADPTTSFRLPPARNLGESLLLATWNIRELAPSNHGGPRLPESYFYLAELIDHFDIVAVQEVRDDLRALNRVKRLLGGHWDAVITDTNKEPPGNGERMAVLYDTRKVHRTGISGEFLLPRSAASPQLARTPLVSSFQVGWTTFLLAVVHILWGDDADDLPERVAEIRQLAKWMRKRTTAATKNRVERGFADEWENLVLLGDFNIFRPDSLAMKALTVTGGFTIPPELQALPHTNLAGGRHYDQIAVRTSGERFGLTGLAGAIDWSTLVFRPEDAAAYGPDVKPRMSYGGWRTYQMSDHLILWVEIAVDHAPRYLNDRLADPAP